ncbi:MAG: sulfatase-like hydrolase/transferase [Oscillospiraceae bacterium]|nr:sulfatase-like hydrolase/transferase [Oscillospiraceae bacterium]
MGKKRLNPKLNGALFWLLIFAAPLAAVLIPDIAGYSLVSPVYWAYVRTCILLYAADYILFLLIHAALTGILRRVSLSAGFLCLLSAVIGVANNNKLLYRGDPLLPSDVFLLGDAITMVDSGYALQISKSMIFIAVCSILLAAVLFPVRIPDRLQGGTPVKRAVRTAAFVLLCAAVAAGYTLLVICDDSVTDALGYRDSSEVSRRFNNNTYYLEFFKTLHSIMPHAPRGYSERAMTALGEEIQAHSVDCAATPDIIVVIDESWADLDAYDVQFDRNLFENYDRLSQQGVSGKSVSPLLGGGTADVEFEVLTGFTTNDTQICTTAFTLFMYSKFPGIVNDLAADGYSTIALHAHTSELYKRGTAYPQLGFQQVYFRDSFDNPELRGDYITDESCFEKAISLYEQAAGSDKPVFLHVLTMQNHVPFSTKRYDDDELVGCTSDTYSEEDLGVLAQYATSVARTDAALGELTDYLSTVDRDVLLVFVGDHQTRLSNAQTTYAGGDILEKYGFYDTYDADTDFAEIHATPYLVWTNYDRSLDGTTFGTIVPNRLLVDALSAYNVERPAYFDYIYTQYNTMNGMTADYCVGTDNKVYFTKTAEQQAEYEQRQLIQYDLIFGRKYLLDYIY